MIFSYLIVKERERIKKAIKDEIALKMQARYKAKDEKEKEAIFLLMAGMNNAIKIIDELDSRRG